MKTKNERSLRLILNKSKVVKLTKIDVSQIKGMSRHGCNTDMEEFGCTG